MSADLMPVVAYASDDTSELYTPAELADYIIERPVPLVRKADAEAAIASLQARLDAAERDAARYRWLRDSRERQNALCLLVEGYWSPAYTASDVDAAIDAATQEKP